MTTQNAEMDVESLQKSQRRRGGFLDAFLVVSVIFLFAAVATLAVVGVMTVKDVESRLKPPSWTSESTASKLTSDDAVYTNFAYVEAETSDLKNATMRWIAEENSVGSNFKFDQDNHRMKLVQSGAYFIYVSLHLTCTYTCQPGVLTVNVGDKLTCQVELPECSDARHVTRKCWTVSRVDSHEMLVAQMTVPKAGLENWRLENSAGFGMFLVG